MENNFAFSISAPLFNASVNSYKKEIAQKGAIKEIAQKGEILSFKSRVNFGRSLLSKKEAMGGHKSSSFCLKIMVKHVPIHLK